MNVKTVCLAILTQGETTGYEIRKRSTEGDFSFFLEASFGSIYPALSKLEEDGWSPAVSKRKKASQPSEFTRLQK